MHYPGQLCYLMVQTQTLLIHAGPDWYHLLHLQKYFYNDLEIWFRAELYLKILTSSDQDNSTKNWQKKQQSFMRSLSDIPNLLLDSWQVFQFSIFDNGPLIVCSLVFCAISSLWLAYLNTSHIDRIHFSCKLVTLVGDMEWMITFIYKSK